MILLPAEAVKGEAFDTLLTDPPYSEDVHAHPVSCGSKTEGAKGAVARDFGFGAMTPELQEYLSQCAASVKGYGVQYSDLESGAELQQAAVKAGAEAVRLMIWTRWSMPQLSADRPCQGAEMLVLTHGQDAGPRGGRYPRRKRWYGPGWLTHFEHCCLRGDDKHPTEKPLDQSLDLVSYFSAPGDRIYDPCAGAGGIGLACAMLGREYLGFELSEEHAARGRARIEAWRTRRSLEGRDTERLGRWKSALAANRTKATSILEAEEAKIARWQEKHPGEGVPKRLKPSVQNIRYLEASARDLKALTA